MRRDLACRALLAALLLVAACGEVPQDPRGTLDRARGGTLRVGVTESAPWLTRNGATPGGVEAGLIRSFAAGIDADVEWIWGPQEEHLEALGAYELDLVAGGLGADTPWSSHVGLSRPYARERRVLAVPPGENGLLMALDRHIHRARRSGSVTGTPR